MRQPPIFLGGKPYLELRAMEQEANVIIGDSIRYLRTFGKFLYLASAVTACIELGKNAIELFAAARDPEARETHEVAYYAMATAISAFCVFCVFAVGLELAVIGGTMGIAGGIMNAFLEPLSKQKYVSASQALTKESNKMSKEDFANAVRILRRAQGRGE